jgi:hypothetical protein
MAKDKKPRISKENFIDFLSSATPEEINDLIVNKGKPPKRYTPLFIYKRPEDRDPKQQEEKSNGKSS